MGETVEQSTKEVVLTYQTLYELLRKEKSRPELQKIDDNFFQDVLTYFREKQQAYDDNVTKNDIFSQSERDKLHIQIANIRKILKDLYDIRERKIVNMSINKSRTNTHIVDTENLLPQERQLFESMHSVLGQYRTGILNRLLEMREPDILPVVLPLPEETKVEEAKPEAAQVEETSQTGSMKITFLENVEQFAGPDLELYGPFTPTEAAELPEEVAQVLISQGKAKAA